MDKEAYSMMLNTISITLECLNAEVTHFDSQAGPITQSIWNESEIRQIKTQLTGLLSLLPKPEYFNS